jgi:Family of unknown function (DUF5689)
MIKNMNHLLRFLPVLLLLVFSISSCVKDDFDEPPANGTNPDLTATHTLREFKDSFDPAAFTLITTDVIISGIVVADDRSGNFYQTLVIQDETAGLHLSIDASSLFNTYPVGRRIFIKAKGLVYGNYADLPQLGGGTVIVDGETELVGIPSGLITTYIEAGEYGLPVVPLERTISELSPADYSSLIRLTDVQFTDEYKGQPYADAVNNFSINMEIEDCNCTKILLRNSGFADFAEELTPEGNGSLVAVYSVFGSDRQLFIRDVNDVNMTADRCGGGSGGGGDMTIAALRGLYNCGGGSTIPAGTSIEGTVISDFENGNINFRNLIVQDATAGIVVRFLDGHSFPLNQNVRIDISGGLLGDFNGLVQVSEIPLTSVTDNGAGTTPAPKMVTVSDVIAQGALWESTLVEINGINFSSGSGNQYSSTPSLNDGTGSIDLFTSSSASFAANAFPTGVSKVTAIVGNFNGNYQLGIRNLDDVIGGSGGTDPEKVNIGDLRNLYGSGVTAGPANSFIEGVVISDYENLNTTGRNLVVQGDDGRGIVVRFLEDHAFPLGAALKVTVSAMELSEFNGLVQVNNVPLGNASTTGAGTLPDPVVLTIADLLVQGQTLESTLVKLENVTITGATTYNGTTIVTDATGNIDMFTRGAATFAALPVPSGTVDLTAIVSDFNAIQVYIRNLNDVQ